ncbi:myeloid differentiation primary response protein MyD88-A-like isoform X1 [Stylophora pistillata]|uniref:Myeloid differentiation primary response protein MyD88-A n=1 Tax=Stylophora pistillata TaxID=50429 RepID=A0A2B4RPD9_STYPI|nr:myeloid differentiation primary response protein MyD88-A-like isoform X1 [Stylophora pistillata]PFX20294.1 Myeloid differentiation primary response protein MyD88-A [Stylophora pistillata]
MSGEKLVKDLSYEAHFQIYKLLLPPALGRDWKTLADKMGYSQETILYYECLNNPVKELISDYESKGKPISELLTFLEEMERFDLKTDLEKYVEETPTPEEREEKIRLELEMKQGQAAEKPKTMSDRYDVFIAYAQPDRPFADELVKKLEAPPYNLKVCIDYRDFLCGNDPMETAAEAIEKYCRKVLLILSENFNRCEKADFQANVALSLSADVRHTNLIPIVYKPCKIPTTLQFITHLDYTKKEARQHFWNLLTMSLGCSNGCANNREI